MGGGGTLLNSFSPEFNCPPSGQAPPGSGAWGMAFLKPQAPGVGRDLKAQQIKAAGTDKAGGV